MGCGMATTAPSRERGRGDQPGRGRAALGSLWEEAAFLMRLLVDFQQQRARDLQVLFGRDVVVTETRSLLMRYVMLAFAAGRPLRVTEAQRRLATVASTSTVRAEVALLEEQGVLALERTGSGRARQTFLWPTERTVRWYN